MFLMVGDHSFRFLIMKGSDLRVFLSITSPHKRETCEG